jgi:hypothetical protein
VTASLRRTVIVTVAALGAAFLLVWAAASAPVVVTEEQQPPAAVPLDTPDESSKPEPLEESEKPQQDAASERETAVTASWAEDLVTLALVVAAVGLLGLVVRDLLLRVGRALPKEQLVLELEPRPDVEAGREALARDHSRYAEALAGSGVRDGIVACWVLMEEAAAGAGVRRRPSETATELVVRFLHALDVDPRPVAQLAGLYHEARFSSHAMGAGARNLAQEALDAIHRDLEHSRILP